MRQTLVKLSIAVLLTSCSNNTQNDHEDIAQLKDAKNNKTFLTGPAEVIQKAQSQMDGLANYIQSSGGDIKKVFNELNQISSPSDNSYSQSFVRGILSEDGRLTCIQDYKVAVDFDPRNIGKHVNKFHGISYSLVNNAIKEFEKTSDNEIMTTYADLETDIKDPQNQKKLLSKKYVLMIYGRKALLGNTLNKQQHSKFMCYIAYPVK
ncbi:MAG TPA: hypothetical protein DIC42_02710 [Holosporales bacterium]|nr:hypothetical protein [Holosporales bacterium]